MKIFKSLFVFVVLVAVSITSSCQQKSKQVTIITADSLNSILDKPHGVILDVRTPEEFAAGHIPGAVNIDFKSDGFEKGLDSLDKNTQYEVYCRSGNRSGRSVELMEKKGFTNIYHFDGGILKWEEKGFKTEK